MANPVVTQPDCNAMRPRFATALVQSTHHQYSNLTVKVVRRGATVANPLKGNGFSEGEHRGGTRSSEEVRRPCEAVGRGNPGGPTTRPGAPVAPWTESPDPQRSRFLLRLHLRPLRLRSRPPSAGSAGLRPRLQASDGRTFADLRRNSGDDQEILNRASALLIHSE